MLRFDKPEIKAAATPALLERGCVHVIGLEPLRERAGPRWDKGASGIHAKLEAMLRQQLGPSDFFAPLNDVAYLITMPSSDRDDAELSCLRIAYDFYSSYLGRCDLAGLPVYRAAQGAGDAVHLTVIPIDRISAIAARAGIPDTWAPARPSSTPPKPGAPPSQRPREPRSDFLPIWDARNQAVTSYACVPQRNVFVDGTPLPPPEVEPREQAKADLTCLRQGVAVLMRHLQRGDRFLMTLRMAFDSLASPVARMEFVSLCRDLPGDLRQYLLFELVTVPEGVPQSRLVDLMTALRPYAKAVRVQVAANCHNYFPYQGLSLQAIGLDLTRHHGNAKEIHNDILRLSNAARRLSLSTFLSGVSNLAALKAARESDIQFLSGPAIGLSLPEPRSMTRLSWAEVVEAAAKKGAAA